MNHVAKFIAPDVDHNGVYTVTPELAKRWLERNNRTVTNRPVNKTRVAFYADAMSRNEWKLNGDTIRFSGDGDLLDGQHRLLACIQAGVSFESFVVFGLADHVFDTIDNGMPRNSAHVLAIRGEKNAASLSATLTLLWKYLTKTVQNPSARPTNQQLERLLDAHGDLREAIRVSERSGYRNAIPTKSVSAFLYYAAGRIDPDKRDIFLEAVVTGVGLTAGHPALLLRDRMLSNKAAKAKLRTPDVLALTIKSWNAFYAGRKLQNLRWRTNGDAAETFPRLTPDPFG